MNISYAILTHNENTELEKLLSILCTYKEYNDEIIIVDDYSDKLETIKLLEKQKKNITVYARHLENNFAKQKNFLNSCCNNEWIFNIDADEYPSDTLIMNLYSILEQNSNIDAIKIPRVNIVNGITDNHIRKWGWKVNDKGWVNWPDFQFRLYKNKQEIKWERSVHEQLIGYKNWSQLPIDNDNWALFHLKNIDKQEKQNKIYKEIMNNE